MKGDSVPPLGDSQFSGISKGSAGEYMFDMQTNQSRPLHSIYGSCTRGEQYSLPYTSQGQVQS